MYYILLFALLLTAIIYSSSIVIKCGTAKISTGKYISFIIYCVLIVISAFRFEVGTDYDTYREAIVLFKTGYNPSWLNYEPGFIWLNKILANYTEHGQLLIITTAIITLTLFFIAINKHSVNSLHSWFLFFSLYLYFSSFNIIRQFIAIGIFLVFINSFLERNLKQCICVIIIASLFHTTALLLIPFYFFLNIKMRKRNIAAIFLFSIVGILLINRILYRFFLLFPKYALYKEAKGGGSAYNICFLLLTLAALIYIKEKHWNIKKDSKKLDFYISSCVFALIITMFSFRVVFFARASFYFFGILLFSVPYCWKTMKKTLEGLIYKYGSIVFSILIFIHYLRNNVAGVEPYKLWDGIH